MRSKQETDAATETIQRRARTAESGAETLVWVIDDDWSALRFRKRNIISNYTRKKQIGRE